MSYLAPVAIMPHLWIIPLVAFFVAGLGFLWFFGFERWFGEKGTYAGHGWATFGVILWILAGFGLAVAGIALIPYDAKYYQYYRLEGVLHVETNTFTDGSGELSPGAIGYIDGYPDPIVLDHSRLMALDSEDVSLTCTISWEPYALDVTRCILNGVSR